MNELSVCTSTCATYLPAPAKKWWDGTASAHKPGEGNSSQSVVTTQLKGPKWFTDDQVALE